ncbi:MAG TPA: glycoside hydrolase family 3 N-terminal domain-containing protein [Bacteroidales bacterium]|nr:glycoside hydrolase family 3 N-terminal domain-containing protein [Bacteroidales bacterium]
MKTSKSLGVFILLLAVFLSLNKVSAQQVDPPFLKYMNHPWVDSVLKTLTIDQQIAQCIWVAGYSNRDVSHEVEMTDNIRKYGVGGIVYFQGTPEKQAELTNYYQKISKVPLAISIDAEWGLGMRLTGVEKFPFQMTLGAIQNDSLIYQMGSEIASQFKREGVQVNLAPDADINNNPGNPIINYRSFGENRDNVSRKTIMYMNGMQDNGVLGTAKHFPGHGDTNVDSHLDLPLISHSRARLDSIELYPFGKLINEGLGCVMTAHLSLPAIDTTKGLAATLSPVIITDILQKEMGFKGLVITDAMNMKGITKYFKPGEAEAKALAAGNDVIEFVTDIEAAIRETKNYITSKKLTKEDIAFKCRKNLAMKYWAGLNRLQPVSLKDINDDLSPMTSKALIRDLYANALTVLNNNNDIIPVKHLENIKIATIAIDRDKLSAFQKRVGDYFPADHFYFDPSDPKTSDSLLKQLSGYDIVIAGVFGMNQRPNDGFGLVPATGDFIEKLVKNNKTIITWFGNPYSIDKVKSLSKADGLILAYQENDYTEDLSAQLIFGGIGAKGTLPVTINEKWVSGFGINTPCNLRLQYGVPESAGLSSEILNRKIDSLVNLGLKAKAFPGCEVMIARKGIVVFHQTYGYQTYDNRTPVTEEDLFDLASVTKISAGLPGLMLLDTYGKFSPDAKLGDYLPYYKKSNKENLLMRDILTHQAGLTPFIPFWKETLKKDGTYKKNIYRSEYSSKYPLEVAPYVFINKDFRKKMFSEIKKSPLGEKKYVYSDLTFIITPEIVEKATGRPWSEYVTDNIYKKIGAYNLTFNPYKKYPLTRIIPTEYDSLFRKQQLRGTVHDETAAMLGGISGHAGLFATANDEMKLLELYRRMGEYGGEQIIGRDVMEEYTKVQYPENNNRRGLGFDKPLLNNKELAQPDTYPTRSASPESFGHTGYTGTYVWIDPVNEISYLFFCNRVYPTRNNNIVSDLNIRPEILQSVYDAIKK